MSTYVEFITQEDEEKEDINEVKIRTKLLTQLRGYFHNQLRLHSEN